MNAGIFFLFFLCIYLIPLGRVHAENIGIAAENKPSRRDLLWDEVNKNYNRRDYKKAARLCKQFATENPNDKRIGEAVYIQGKCWMETGNSHRAIQLWEGLVYKEKFGVIKKGAGAKALAALIDYYTIEGMDLKADAAVETLLALYPRHKSGIDVCAERAAVLLREENYRQAAELYEKIEAELKSPADIRNYKLAFTLSSKKYVPPAEMLEIANESFESDDRINAETLYTAIVNDAATPPDICAEAKCKVGWCYYLNNELKKAENLWKEVINETRPGSRWRGESRFNLIALTAGNYDDKHKAIELCEIQAKEFKSGFLREQAMYSRAWLYWVEEDWEKAKEAFDDLTREFPRNADHPPIKEYIRDCVQGMRRR